MESEDLMSRLFDKFDFAIVLNFILQNFQDYWMDRKCEISQLQDDH